MRPMKKLPTDRWCYIFDSEVPVELQLRKLKQLFPDKELWSPLSDGDLRLGDQGLNVTLGYVGVRALSYGFLSNVEDLLLRHPDFPVFHWKDLNLGIRRQLTT